MVDNGKADAVPNENDLHICIWFSKCLFFNIKMTGAHDIVIELEKKGGFCEDALVVDPVQENNKLRFAQWYEILDGRMLAIDGIDKALGCMRIRWQQMAEQSNLLSAGGKFGILKSGNI